MAHKKAGGSAKNLTDSQPKYLGVKLFSGQKAQPGSVIVRQRGTRILPGKNVRVGKDHTLFSTTEGVVEFRQTRKQNFNNTTTKKKIVHVNPVE